MRETVLWGHHLDDYRRMFALSDVDERSRLLEYGCGITAVNAECHTLHHMITSCDPLFSLPKDELQVLVDTLFNEAVYHVQATAAQYDCRDYGSLDALIDNRRKGVGECLADYQKGQKEKRYLPVDLDAILPFDNFTFDLALSSYFLFSSMANAGADFHLWHIRELARVAKEVRIFPLISVDGRLAPEIGPVLIGLQQGNYGVEIRDVDYQLQSGAHAMLRVWARECIL